MVKIDVYLLGGWIFLLPRNSVTHRDLLIVITIIALSQAPRHYESNPQENLTQLYPYPEKSDGPSTDTTTSKPTTKALVTEAIATTNVQEPECPDTDDDATQVREHDPLYEHTPPNEREEDADLEHDIDIDKELACFDIDLDTVSEEQAAALALQMLRAMSMADSPKDQHEPTIKTEDEEPLIGQTHSAPLEPEQSTAIETKPTLASSDDTFTLTTTNLEINQKVMRLVEPILRASFPTPD